MRKLHRTSVFAKDLKKLPHHIQQAAWETATCLMRDVFDKSLDVRKLEGYKGVWRVTVKKDYRLVFSFDKETVYLLRMKHRKDIYRKDIQL